MKKLLLLIGAAALMAACSEGPTAPSAQHKAPSLGPSKDFTCRSGYVVAFDQDGNPYCAAETQSTMQTKP